MKKLLIILFSLFTLTSYSQDDDIYWTVYDVDTVEEETTTYVTNNYYSNYTSRIHRFHRRPYYASYWSYYNPYWYSYYYPFYTSYYWWWYSPSWWWNGWYSSYHSWYSYHNYSYRHTYAYYQPQYRTASNTNKKITKYQTPKYQKSKQVKYTYSKPSTQPQSVKKYGHTPVKGYKPVYSRPQNVHTTPSRRPKHTPSRAVTPPTRATQVKPVKTQRVVKPVGSKR